MAAGVVIGGGVGLFVWSAQSVASAHTEVGARRTVQAADGVTIELNTDSAIRWKSKGEVCSIWLDQGEIAIAIDGSKTPGAVLYCDDRAVMLTEGSYIVRARDGGGDVIVLEGRARPRDEQTVGVPGQKIQVSDGPSVVQYVPKAVIEAAVAWRRDEIIFDGETLAAAVAEYNRYLDRKLVIQDPSIAHLRVGGRFDTERPTAFISSLQLAFDLQAVPSDAGVLLKKKVKARLGDRAGRSVLPADA